MRNTTNVANTLLTSQKAIAAKPTFYNQPGEQNYQAKDRKNKSSQVLLSAPSNSSQTNSSQTKPKILAKEKHIHGETKPKITPTALEFPLPVEDLRQSRRTMNTDGKKIALNLRYNEMIPLSINYGENTKPIYYHWPKYNGKLVNENVALMIVLNKIFQNISKRKTQPLTILVNTENK